MKDEIVKVEQELAIGQVQWHCSEPDGGPDVGILLRIDADHHLWVGDSVSSDGLEGSTALVIYGRDGKREARELDYDGLREVIEDFIAPALARLSTAPLQEEVERPGLRDAFMAGRQSCHRTDRHNADAAWRTYRAALSMEGAGE